MAEVLYCAVPDVEAVIHTAIQDDEDHRAWCLAAIKEATAAIVDECRQEIHEVADDAVTFDVWSSRRRFLNLPNSLEVGNLTVVEDGVTLTAGPDEDYVLVNSARLYRVGQYWASGPQIVVVTFDHGYDEIPDLVMRICARAASRVYQAGLRAAADGGVLGVASKSLGDFAVAYSSGATGGVGEGILGVSGARLLLMSERDALRAYRLETGP